MTKISYEYKVIWADNYIGIAIDQLQGENVPFALTTFYFWPKENGWTYLCSELESKPWMTEAERTNILNGFAMILEFWLIYRFKTLLKVFLQSKNLNFRLVACA